MIFLGRCSYMSPLPIKLNGKNTIPERHCRGAGEDVPHVVKTDLFQTVCLQQFLEPLSDDVWRERNNMIGSRLMRHLLYQCINVCRQIDIAHTLDRFAVVDLCPAAVHLDDLPTHIEPHLHRINSQNCRPATSPMCSDSHMASSTGSSLLVPLTMA